MSYVDVGSLPAGSGLNLVERPVTPEEAAHAQGAIVAALQAVGAEVNTANVLAVTRANGVADTGSRNCTWVKNLAVEVLKRGGRRGSPAAANTCEDGKGYAMIVAGNVWRLPTRPALPSVPALLKKKDWTTEGLLVAMGLSGVLVWKITRRRKKAARAARGEA